MTRVIVYSTANCAFCVRAKTMLADLGIDFEDSAIDTDEAAHKEFTRVTNGARTVPQIIIDGVPIGGFAELAQLQKQGRLDNLM